MLTDAAIRRIKHGSTPRKRSDGLGLYLLVAPSGSRLWRMNYRFAGRQKTLTFGAYPEVSLEEARAARDAARRMRRQGLDPGAVAKAEKQMEAAAAASAFTVVADEWLEKKVVGERKAPNTIKKQKILVRTLKAALGDRPLNEIEPPDLLVLLRRVEAAGHHETVARLRSTASRIFRYGIATGRCSRDPAADLRGATTSAVSTPRPAVTDPAEIGRLLRAIDGFPRPLMRLGLKLLALTAVRPGELLSAEWGDIVGDVWNIPARRAKMRRVHRVPLSRQALEILAELRLITGRRKHLLASPRNHGRPLAGNQFNYALRELGITDHVAHGFRALFSTLANEFGLWSTEVIELQLAHVERNNVRRAYNRSMHWAERVRLVQWHADHLDELHARRGEVVALPAAVRS